MLERHIFLTIDDLANLPKPEWAIEGLFEKNALVMVAGPPASLKSFMALDWQLCMASGLPWNARPTQILKSLYSLGEGKASLYKRILAWIHAHRLGPDAIKLLSENFRITFEVPQMAIKASVDNLLAGLSESGFKPDVIVIDTFARSFVGLDENSQKDTGLWVESAERLRATGMAVIAVHHTKKNVEMGVQYRGSTVIMGAMDTAMTMTKHKGIITLTISKQKDHDEGEPMFFTRSIVQTDPTEEGSIVLVPSAAQIDERLSPEYRRQEALLEQLVEDASFESDRARARELARQCSISESAAQTKIARRRKSLGGGD